MTENREKLKYRISRKSVQWELGMRTDRHDAANSCFSQFCECAKKTA